MYGADEGYKINLGCGTRWATGWQNVDNGPLAYVSKLRVLPLFNVVLPKHCHDYPRDLILADLRRIPLPFSDNSASVIFSGYVLEYLSQDESYRVLRDCYRILKPDGLIRLCQTDIGSIVDFYLANKDLGPSKEACEIAAGFLRLAAPQHTELIVRLFRRGGVQQLFDRGSIQYALQKAGFKRIVFHKVHEGECPDLPTIERPERQIAPLLHVEARKSKG